MPNAEPPSPSGLPEAPKFKQLQNFLTTLSALLISIYLLIISHNIYYLLCIIPNLKNSEAAEKLSSDSIGIIALILLCLILQITFIYGIQKSKEWLLLFNSIFAFIITIICFMVTAMWMDKNFFNGPYDLYFW
uniref:Uncharacterized protein n=1 Tax=Panagrolaimus sp. PS1159 TaxID=55785 RepID=A0AC35FQJ6_9BILA